MSLTRLVVICEKYKNFLLMLLLCWFMFLNMQASAFYDMKDMDKWMGLDRPGVWDVTSALEHLSERGLASTRRTVERRLQDILPRPLEAAHLADESGQKPIAAVLEAELASARQRRELVLFAQMSVLPNGNACIQCNDARGARYWIPLHVTSPEVDQVKDALTLLRSHLAKSIVILPHGKLIRLCEDIGEIPGVRLGLLAYRPIVLANVQTSVSAGRKDNRSVHLDRLEAESIHIFREAVSEAKASVMLYSAGKDSSVMLHLARKAFFPASPPFPLLHVDTRWKFHEMYLFRDQAARDAGMELIVHVNPVAVEKNINPFDHGSAMHTHITKTEGLKQALDKGGYDIVFGGGRRDEEKSRAKERIFSVRSRGHVWDPKKQRVEVWDLYNARLQPSDTLRVFPLSNWTELDIWQYIDQEKIPVVPLYFSRVRPVVIRDGMLIVVDDDRFQFVDGERIEPRRVRFRTLGCYPLTGAVESTAQTVPEIVDELLHTRLSERSVRRIDSDAHASMEQKKREGYF